jgi:GNAT superfamily N-acetyltransferase
MEITCRPFRPLDQQEVGSVCHLLQDVLPGEAISDEAFAARVLNDPNADAQGSWIACAGSRVVGFVHSIHRKVPVDGLEILDADTGYVSLLAVSPEHEGRGIGSALLSQVEEWLKSTGVDRIIVGPYSPNYFAPGVSVEYSRGHKFFESHGYLAAGRPISMKAQLMAFAPPAWLDEVDLDANGITVSQWTPPATAALLEFAAERFAPDWARFVREAVEDIVRGADPRRLMAAFDQRTGQVVGFSHYSGERFGPIGVDPDYRGRAIGQVLCRETMLAQKAVGHEVSWFLWSNLETADRLYNGFGFKLWREFVTFRKDI